MKIKSRDCAFKLLHVEFFAVDEGVKVENIAGKKESFAGHVRKKAQEEGKEPPFLLVICFNFDTFLSNDLINLTSCQKVKNKYTK